MDEDGQAAKYFYTVCLPVRAWSRLDGLLWRARESLLTPQSARLFSDGLGDLPKVAFGIGKVRYTQPPGFVGWGLDTCDALGLEFFVRGIHICH